MLFIVLKRVKDKLKSQLSVLSEGADLENPFITSSDKEDAAQDFNKIDEDDDIDIDIEMLVLTVVISFHHRLLGFVIYILSEFLNLCILK